MYEKFSTGARQALTRAKAEAGARDSAEITLVHVLAGLVHSDSEASSHLAEMGIDGQAIDRILPPPRLDPSTLEPGAIPFSDAAKRGLTECVRQAVTEDGLDAIRSDHLLGALAASEETEITEPLASAGLALQASPEPG